MSLINLRYIKQLQEWMDSEAGQTFLNTAYSLGAAVVILGTLFKLTQMSGADCLLYVGMGTEVFVFTLSAFDRPFNKVSGSKTYSSSLEDGNISIADFTRNKEIQKEIELIKSAYNEQMTAISEMTNSINEMDKQYAIITQNIKVLNKAYVQIVDVLKNIGLHS